MSEEDEDDVIVCCECLMVFNGDLGDEYCPRCWDLMGLDGQEDQREEPEVVRCSETEDLFG